MTQSTTRLMIVTLAALVVASFGLATATLAQDTPAGDPVHGRSIYLADGCYECHGRVGQGGGFNYPTPALAKLEMPVESFVAFLRDAPHDMPSFSPNVLSDKDAADIWAFLQSLPGRKPAKDFPLLNQ